ncbi:helix-turn-helix domain-containing protein [Anaerovorax odorimutans]|uniref:Helix-turn-helix domain-containing protein n=1 Tax=Anaerovorax odorimutans TaxID=109327 RepID=A0ABT1RQU2_9FIRM|nr:helix-turn-helix domain-containing protein [Anaerovorax odorimutans]MCQ4637538.1 helix-turn-helix domain-containing protein [Anaerovorax odorimutans]
MLSENIKAIRKSKGLSQEELAIKLNIVRQTISKWENGRSVPDSDMLISISEALETPVSTLLGENVIEPKVDDLKAIAEKLEIINLQLAQRKATKQKRVHRLLISLCAIIVIISAVLIAINSPYLGWNYSDPETAVFGAAFHVFEWLFVRLAPIILIGAIFGIFLTRNHLSLSLHQQHNRAPNQ